MKGRGNQEEFGLKDFWEDWILERLHDWIESNYPEVDKTLEKDDYGDTDL